MKVLHIITGLGVGGAEQQLRLLLRHLPARCDVVTLTNPGPVADGLTADGVRVVHLGMSGNRDLRALPRLTALIRAGRYDLVHTHLYRACLYGRLAARIAGVRAVVATEHSLGEAHLEGRPLTAGVRGLYLAGERLGRATVAVSPTVADRLRRWGVPAQRIHVVPNGIDAGRFRFDPRARARVRAGLGLSEEAVLIGAVGRLTPPKRFDVLIDALPQLPPTHHLVLVGDGPEAPALREAARGAGVAARVHFTGECPPQTEPGNAGSPFPAEDATLPELLSAMDVLASPSPEETFGLAVLEGLAAGLPVVYADCPALDDLPTGRPTRAHRVPSTPQAFTDALRHPPAPRDRTTADDAVHHYDIAHSATRLTRVYERVTSR
ncbi:glycosyltransferase [Streptomyces sp. NPDC058001]|uniref:glycosyltransferase n=1 Tax=Streptomyces sp. NPDC058001 TaxID=3346300 RepID=UPI0036E53FEF